MSSAVESLSGPQNALDADLLLSDARGPPDSSSQRASSPELTSLTSLTLTPQPQKPSVYVEISTLPPHIKAKYATDLSERAATSTELFPESEMREIIGEYQAGSRLFYYVKLSDDNTLRFDAKTFRTDHPKLVEVYELRKNTGELPLFDPSATYIHPSSRVKMVIKFRQNTRSSRPSEMSDADTDELVIGGKSASYSDSDDAYSESDETPLRRTTRTTAAKVSRKKQLKLPFSPKKTRSRRIASLSEDSDVQEATPPRRSIRARKAARMNLDDEAYGDVEESSDEFVQGRSTKFRPTSKVVRGKASRPAYGHFRTVADLDYDEDEDTAVLRAHRDFCEKCERKPAHLLLQALKKDKGRMRRRKRKNNGSDVESEEDDNDEERITALGGWVRCLKCPLAAHWRCLAKSQRDEILRAALERDKAEWLLAQGNAQTSEMREEGTALEPPKPNTPEPAKRAGLDPYQTTEFICGQCMKGGICMGCMQVVLQSDTTHISSSARPVADSAAEHPGVADDAAEPSKVQDSTAELPKVEDGAAEPPKVADEDVKMANAEKNDEKSPGELLFRCWTCKRISHYAHLPLPPFAEPDEEWTSIDRAHYYQDTTQWQCADCHSFVYTVEHILAWRPFPSTAVEPPLPEGEIPNYKSQLPREYLVKWVDRSYRRTQWVPHMWLVATHAMKLKNFLSNGPRVALLPEPVPEAAEDSMQVDESLHEFGAADEDMDEEADGTSNVPLSSLDPMPDAERRIKPAWKTIDRILDVLLWNPERRTASLRLKKTPARGKHKVSSKRVDSDDDSLRAARENADKEFKAAFDDGEEPSGDLIETVDAWERRNQRELREEDIDLVVWGFFKWNGLGYDDATWDSPPRKEEPSHKAFFSAFKRFLASRQVTVKALSKKEMELFDRDLPKNIFMKRFAFSTTTQPQLGQSDQLSLMPFQVEGVNWLCDNWWNRQPCILADEMGLGKTVQIVTFLGAVIRGGFKGFEQVKAMPALVVVPNSTITNWVREFERWAPQLRVVPFYGEAKSRDVIKKYELFHASPAKHTTGVKYHVLVTTYETVTNAKEFAAVFKSTPRWEVLVVDEGQRLKSDSSLIFRKLKELNTVHRIILTGTPLNNNIRELFNLMNFLDPVEWRDLEALAKEHEVLTEDSVKELHTRLRPYFLRRIKSEVLELPPKNEVIVPVSMSPLQKEVYRSILSQNLNLLRSLAQTASGTRINAAVKKSNMNNMLMQLRKCLQHPYLVSREIEPTGLQDTEAHEKLIGASAKLRLLHSLLPKLKARGHRVLLFSQFVIALDIIEDFLIGENIKYLRLDGNTKQADRQRDMDEFNRPDSDVFIYILSTRAGGVGINLWTADTVIIFDPDFNPHQDLQAISRAHRYGQRKTCLVFKLMVKDSAEERIIQTGKKKLVLDHLIVQKMDDDDDSDDVKSILMFGAQALFDEGNDQSTRDIHYSEHDIDNLIEKTEKEGDQPEAQAGEAFSFAKVWAADKDALEDVDDGDTQAQEDAWAQTLARIAEENAKEKAKEVTGRGVRRKAAAVFPSQSINFEESPKNDHAKKKKRKGKSKATSSDSDVYVGSHDSDGESSGPSSEGLAPDLAELGATAPVHKKPVYVNGVAHFTQPAMVPPPLPPILNRPNVAHGGDEVCGLCGLSHPEATCFMTESSENLAQYRNILLTHSGDEPLEDRQAAIDVIDETLYKRGKMHLIYGQPLHPVDPPARQGVSKSQAQAPALPRPGPVQPHQMSAGALNGQADTIAVVKRPQPFHPLSGPSSRPDSSNRTADTVPGPSKRPASPPHPAGPPSKKVKATTSPACVVCGRSYHLLKSCPAVAEGSERIEKELRRLAKDMTVPQGVLSALEQLLVKHRQREQLARSGTGP